jgi:hypothetical protein
LSGLEPNESSCGPTWCRIILRRPVGRSVSQ